MQQIISMELHWNCSSLLVIRTHTTKASDRHTLDWRALSWIKTSLCWRICGTSARINNQKQPGLMMVHVFTSWTDDDGTHVHFLDWWWWYTCSLPWLMMVHVFTSLPAISLFQMLFPSMNVDDTNFTAVKVCVPQTSISWPTTDGSGKLWLWWLHVSTHVSCSNFW